MKYRVHVSSRPAPGLTFYDGHVDVDAEDLEQAEQRALDKLKRGAFPDRSRSDWRIRQVEGLP